MLKQQKKQRQNFTNNINDYYWNIDDKLGYGQSGMVFKGCNMAECNDPKDCAIKIISVYQYNQNKILQQQYTAENKASELLKSKNLFTQIEQIKQGNYIYTIQDLYLQGTLRDFMNHNRQIIEEKSVLILRQIVCGMKDLHNSKMSHLNLYPGNILIFDKLEIKIKGFNNSYQISADHEMKFNVGARGYQSPQVINKQVYTQKTDIWSLGIIFYEMLFGFIPFYNYDDNYDVAQMKNIYFPHNIVLEEQSYDFLLETLQFLEKDRIQFENLFEHPILQENKFNKLNYKLNQNQVQILNELQNKLLQKINWESFLLQNFFNENQCDKKSVQQFLIYFEADQEFIYDFLGVNETQNISFFMIKIKIMHFNFKDFNCDHMLKIRGEALIKKLTNIVFQKDIVLQRHFKKFDFDRNDNLCLEEFQKIIKSIDFDFNILEIMDIFKYMDENQDETISQDEFVKSLEIRNNAQYYFSYNKFQQLSNNSKKVIQLIKIILIKYQVNIQHIFDQVDNGQKGWLNLTQFTTFINKFNNFMTDEEILQIFQIVQSENLVLDIKNFALFFT